MVNELLREADALPQLRQARQLGLPPARDAARRRRSPTGWRSRRRWRSSTSSAWSELDRLRVCAADDCDDVLVDLSKNRSRRFCEAGCGNRANVAAYRARQADAAAARR